MATSDMERELRAELTGLVKELGFHILELHAARVQGRTHLELVIYRADGVSMDDCANVHRVVRPRAELVLDDRDVAVQVASPGIDRTLKSDDEFALLVGRGVSILRRETDDWIGGLVHSASEADVTLRVGENLTTVAFEDIQKARLDYSQEVKIDHGR